MFEEFFHKYPYTNFHEMNLDWVLSAIKEMMSTIETFVSANAIKYSDPIGWDITSQYEKNTVVIDQSTGTAYLSVATVPSGISLSRTDYWTVIFDLSAFISKAAKNFANTIEDYNVTIATMATSQYEWIVIGDTLYMANVAITPGDAYVLNGNISKFTVEDVIGKVQTLQTTSKTNVVAAINEVLAELRSTAGDLATLTTSDKDSLVEAINEVNNLASYIPGIISDIGDLGDLDTSDNDDLVSAINEVLSSLNLAVANLSGQIGNLEDLTTTDKDSLVDAINEVNNALSGIDAKIGTLSSLTTSDKSNVVAAVNEINAALATVRAGLASEVNKTGNLANLATINKSNLVAAINEVAAGGGGGTVVAASNANLIDNGWFIVNQRYALSGTFDNAIHIDRWHFDNDSLAPAGSWAYDNITKVLTLVGDASQTCVLRQVLAPEIDLSGHYVTISVRLSDDSILAGSALINEGEPNTLITTEAFTAGVNASGNIVFTISNNETVELKTIRCEFGEASSIANDLYPDHATETLKCLRYAICFNDNPQIRCSNYTSDYLYFYLPTPVPMRQAPTAPDTLRVRGYGSSTAVSGFTFTCYLSPVGITLVAIKASHGLTDGVLKLTSSTTRAIFSAEI